MNKNKKRLIHIFSVAVILIIAFCANIKVEADSTWNKYKFTEAQIKGIARVCQREQGSVAGAAAEASLMANRFELYKTSSGTGAQLYNYIKTSGWWGNPTSTMNKWKSVNKKIYNAVEDVLVNGNRTLPQYVDEHDCIDCGSYGYDITKIVTNGKVITNKKELKKHSNYVQGKTVIYNKYGAVYTFYTFPTNTSDPFGYTAAAYKKADKNKTASGNNTNGSATTNNKKDGGSNDELAFYSRVEEVYKTYESNGSNVEPALIAAVFKISNQYGQMKYNDFTTDVIKDIFKYMNSDPDVSDDEVLNYDEESFKTNLIEYWFIRDEFSKYSDAKKKVLAEKVIEHYEEYKYLMGVEEAQNNDGVCSYNVGGTTLTNVKVQLMHCEGKKNLNEDPYDLEDYVTGVIAPEIGEQSPKEALKVQAIAARSFAITRWKGMNGAYGVRKEDTDGGTTLFLRSCTTDQVFCNVDKGCWANSKNGGQINVNNPSDWPNHTIYSGYDGSKPWSKKALSENSPVRTAAEETRGQYLVDKDGNALAAAFFDTAQITWINLAKKGYDYYEILKKYYPKMATIKSDCTSATGSAEAEGWRQDKGAWSSKKIGSKSVAQIGCMVTSAAIQIARSGTKLLVQNFDPGVFMETIKANGAFNNNSWDNMNDSTWASIAPNFKLGGLVTFSGSKADKINQMKKYSEGKNYLIVRVYHPGEHWVAVTKVEGDKVYMADPSSDATVLTSKYNLSTVTKGYYFVKGD